MLIYDEINKEYMEVIPVKKIEEKIDELKINIDKMQGEELTIYDSKIDILEQLIKENCEDK